VKTTVEEDSVRKGSQFSPRLALGAAEAKYLSLTINPAISTSIPPAILAFATCPPCEQQWSRPFGEAASSQRKNAAGSCNNKNNSGSNNNKKLKKFSTQNIK
jgi:hypothetical protein